MPRKNGKDKVSATEAMEQALARQGKEKYVLKLYITGMTARSQQALRNIEKIIKENPDNNFDLEVIDIYQQPTLAKGDQIIAVPTLIKKLPAPLRRLIGDLSQEDRIILGLDLKPKSSPPPQTQNKKRVRNE
ncbi:MAG: thiol-disulfide isomerase [Chloroflexi bacterium]|nr:thiol-disulfide isomerase [Chloroflexota bacterium]